jgi:hypothetical protein
MCTCVLLCRCSLLGDAMQQAGDARSQEYIRFEDVSIIRSQIIWHKQHSFDSRGFPLDVLADA